MPSPAAIKYQSLVAMARVLQRQPSAGLTRGDRQIYHHAALAAHVAAWDAYVKELIRSFFTEIADPLAMKYSLLHNIALASADRTLEKFNTPNWQNTRNTLIQTTAYDPIGDWVWPARHMTGPMVRVRLDEILKVRHSFAHGFAIPPYSWTQSTSGQVRLTQSALLDTDAFFQNIVMRTDKGMQTHIITNYAVSLVW